MTIGTRGGFWFMEEVLSSINLWKKRALNPNFLWSPPYQPRGLGMHRKNPEGRVNSSLVNLLTAGLGCRPFRKDGKLAIAEKEWNQVRNEDR